MRAVVVREFGDPARLDITDVPVPDPGPQQVRIAVTAAGINPVDTFNIQDPSWAGLEVGCVPGFDVSGLVDAVGSGLDPRLVGRPVIAMTPFPRGQGGYAEFAVVDESLVAYLDDGVDVVAAASIPLAAGTAWEVVRHVRNAGPSVLVVGASGGVGLFFLQLAAQSGLRPVALGRQRNHDVMAELGAAHCVDYTQPGSIALAAELAGGQFDSIVDLAGGATTAAAQQFLRDDGVVCAIATPELDVDALIDHNQTFHGVLIRDDGQRLRLLASRYNAGNLRTHVTHQLPLEDVAAAHRLLDSGEAAGKVVLTT
ncbi:MAG: NADP-dependent oxidoreductase [Actinomycetes bacterium]